VRALGYLPAGVRFVAIAMCVTLAVGKETDAELQRRLAAHASLFTLYDVLLRRHARPDPDKNGVVTLISDFLSNYAQSVYLPLADGYVPDPADEELGSLIGSPTIVRAIAKDRRSAFTPGGTFLYSDWDFEIERVFKDRGPESAQLGATITVTRPGGSLVQNGITYVADDKNYPDFQRGSSYILFLHPLPDSHSFQVFEGHAFVLNGFAVSIIDDPQRHSALGEQVKSMTADQFLRTLRVSIGSAAAK
jgi:hypothetical protein